VELMVSVFMLRYISRNIWQFVTVL
jgi:hypothetical protein